MYFHTNNTTIATNYATDFNNFTIRIKRWREKFFKIFVTSAYGTKSFSRRSSLRFPLPAMINITEQVHSY